MAVLPLRGAPGDAWPFVGRTAEVDAALAHLLADDADRVTDPADSDPADSDPGAGPADPADQRRGVVGVLVSGPAGMGKSRLLEELGYRIRVAGRRVIELQFRPDDAGDFVARWQELVAGPDVPVVLADDAHWCDERTAALLAGLAGAERVHAVVARRDDEALPVSLLPLLRDPSVLRIDLAPLADVEVEQVATAALHGTVAGPSVRALRGASGGNPLLLRELIVAARSEGRLVRTKGAWSLRDGGLRAPDSGSDLVEVIADRLDALDRGARDAVDLIAAAGSLPISTLESIAGVDTLVALERAGLVVARDEGDDPLVSLAHPVHTTTARSRFTEVRSRELLSSLVRLAREPERDREVDPLVVASWLVGAGRPGEIQDPVDVARRALDANRYELAEQVAREAWTARGDVGGALVLASTLARQDRLVEARAVVAAASPKAASRVEEAALIGQELMLRFLDSEEFAPSLAFGAEQLARFSPTADAAAHFELASDLGVVLMLAARPLESTAVVGAALNAIPDDVAAIPMASRLRARYAAIASAAFAGIDPDLDPTTQHVERLVASGRRPGTDVDSDFMAWDRGRQVGGALHEIYRGEFAGAEATALALAAESAADGDPTFEGWGHFIAGFSCIFRGSLRAAQQHWLDAWLAFAPHSMDSRMRMVRVGLGLVEQLAPDQVDRIVDGGWFDVLTPGPVMFFEGDRARFEAIPDIFADPPAAAARIERSIPALMAGGMTVAEALARHSLTIVTPDDAANLARLEDIGSRCAGGWIPALVREARARADAGVGSADHDAALAAVVAVGDRLHPHLVLRTAVRDGRAPVGALARLVAGTDLVLSGPPFPSSSSAPGPKTAPGAASSASTGAVTAAIGSVLTDRELEMAEAAVRGGSNREVAEALGVSKRTVDNTLAKVYRKLGVTGREELASLLDRSAG